MGRIAGWLVLLGLGTLCGSWYGSGFSGTLIAGLLASVAAGALCEWLLPSPGSIWGGALVSLLATFIPDWIFFLPALAFEAGVGLGSTVPATGSAGMNNSQAKNAGLGRPRLILALLPAFFWLIPAMVDLILFTDLAQRYALLALLISTLAQAGGLACAHLAVAKGRVWQIEDTERYRIRQLHGRINDLDEERAQATRMAHLSERTRIARDIHDNVGHLLTRAIMQIQAGRVVAQSKGNQSTERILDDVGKTLDEAMTTIRRSVHDLEDEGTDFASQMEDASSEASMGRLQVDLNNGIETAPAPVCRCLATIVREALTNTVRHSSASSAQVILRDLPAFWQMVVQDDGGIQQSQPDSSHPKEPELQRGMGLADMEARARALGGTANSGPNRQGWKVFVSLPKEPWSDHGAAEHVEDKKVMA
ncbi:two-component sensor histidine kinase [Bifidobacterium sp. W8115]|uniref:sensor histidine kinase n=1 Tax=Bifidobacterium TaxID=1678 RepID=UPI0018DC7E89|nr:MULTISPECIES: histidine kinase [Bifidobacterium]MBI0070885.1 two-component sensor histidine kinase [Bifidobacterium sp. W8112]MBI0125142.1 two-component sensor histidine kinase [Bifidobacterium apousia]